MRIRQLALVAALVALKTHGLAIASEPLWSRIDSRIDAAAKGRPASPRVDDAGFVRRVYLDLAGRIPSAREARAFLADPSPSKRDTLIQSLLDSPEYPRRMQELFHVMLMERMGDHPAWSGYLRAAFQANKGWDRITREILSATANDEPTRGASFFYAKRLEHYGENPVDYPGLTRDVGRLFLGIDLRCAQCHDHLFIDDYKQADFQGLHAFFQNAFLVNIKGPLVGEKPTTEKLSYMSVFKKIGRTTGPRVPGLAEVEIPPLARGDEYRTPPDKKTKAPGVLRFSPLAVLAERLPSPENPSFARNLVNRLWFTMMGRGLVQPLDLHHAENPPSHPDLLDLLAKEFRDHGYDIKWFLGELARSQTYQRSDILPEGVDEVPVESFLTASEKRLSAEQLLWSILEAAGERDRRVGPGGEEKTPEDGPSLDALRTRFLKPFGNQPREPEDDFNPSVRAALFLQNDDVFLGLLKPRGDNLVGRLLLENDADKVAEELYVSILTRLPCAEEREEFAAYLAKNAGRREVALGHLAWALLTSAEFGVNH